MSGLVQRHLAAFDDTEAGPLRLRLSDDGKRIVDGRWRDEQPVVARRPGKPWRGGWDEDAAEIVWRFNRFEALLRAVDLAALPEACRAAGLRPHEALELARLAHDVRAAEVPGTGEASE